MSNPEREAKLKSFSEAHSILLLALQMFPNEMWKWKPSPDRWSIHEILVHIADSEVNGYGRFRKAIAESGDDAMMYDQAKWTDNLDYHSVEAGYATDLFRITRHGNYTLIKDIPDEKWSQYTINHADKGKMDLDALLDLYNNHIPGHIRQMAGVFKDWKEKNSSS